MENAEEALKKADKQYDKRYKDKKYVRTACGVAYSGVLVALDAWLAIKGVPAPTRTQRKSIDFYTNAVARLDKKMLGLVLVAYETLHLNGYYDGTLVVATVKGGFDAAYEIIGKIEPQNPVPAPETRENRSRRVWASRLMFLAAMFKSSRRTYPRWV
jgi:hypothetical protein